MLVFHLLFKDHPEIYDHRNDFPWLTGYLGDPFSGIWFVAENPSLSRVESIANREQELVNQEAQWSESPGDILFRKMLVKHGFKEGELFSQGGWKCYITDVIKETDYVNRWRAKNKKEQRKSAEIWAAVFAWELTTSKPRLVVTVGRQAQQLLEYLRKLNKISLPKTAYIQHYSCIGSRPQGKLGPMHPERIKQYDDEFKMLTKIFLSQ